MAVLVAGHQCVCCVLDDARAIAGGAMTKQHPSRTPVLKINQRGLIFDEIDSAVHQYKGTAQALNPMLC